MISQAIPANDDTASADAASADAAVAQQPMSDDVDEAVTAPTRDRAAAPSLEIGGRVGPDPTRYGDWELRGRCIDF